MFSTAISRNLLMRSSLRKIPKRWPTTFRVFNSLRSRGKNNLPSLTKFIVMLEQISELVKQFGRQAVVENPDIPNEQNNAVLAEATNTIAGGMRSEEHTSELQSHSDL